MSKQNLDLESLLDDYATSPVPADKTVSGTRVGLLYAGQTFSVPGFVTGVELAGALGLGESMFAFFVGGFFLTLLGAISGFIGTQTRLSSYMLIKFAFGETGSKLVNFAFALSQFGWFGVQVFLFAQATRGLGQELFGLDIGQTVYILVGGGLMTITTMFGFKLLNRLAVIVVPLMIALMAVLLYKAFGQLPLSEILGISGDLSISRGQAIAAVVGSLVLGAILIPDVCRYAHDRKGAVAASFITFFCASTFVYICVAIPMLVTGEVDTIRIMVQMGVGTIALVLIGCSTWSANSINLYGASLSLSAVVPKFAGWKMTVACGITGTIVAFLGILDHFIPFLIYLSVVFLPIGSIYITDFFLIKHRQYHLEELSNKPGWSGAALTAWVIGSITSYLTTEEIITLSSFSVLDTLLVSGLSYYFLKNMGSKE